MITTNSPVADDDTLYGLHFPNLHRAQQKITNEKIDAIENKLDANLTSQKHV